MPFPAKFPGLCGRCHQPFNKGDQVVKRRFDLIHAGCHSGAQDE
jgi:hypothetical protein